MKHYFTLIIVAITFVFAYPIRSLRDHIKSGNIDYVERYIQDLSEREINQADFQFLNAYMVTDGKQALNIFSKIDISDLSGNLAPILLFKKGNEQYLNNEFDLAINSFKDLAKRYEDTNYLYPAVSMMVNSYLQLGFQDSAQFIRDWANTNLKKYFVDSDVKFKGKFKDDVVFKPKGQFTIQLGAFGIKKNANQSIHKLKKSGYNPRLDKINLNGETLFAVRYGYFETENEARKIQKKLQKDLAVKSFLKKLDN